MNRKEHIQWSKEFTSKTQRRILRRITPWHMMNHFDSVPLIMQTAVTKEAFTHSRCGYCVHYEECREFKSVDKDSLYCHRMDLNFEPGGLKC